VSTRDKSVSAPFLAEILGLPEPTPFGPFLGVVADNGVTLDYIDVDDDYDIEVQHFAFLISDAEFDEIFGRVQRRGLPYWADPAKQQEGAINHHFGGRGVYFEDPDGHLLEIITRPYDPSG
jgi:catechol 2,3-dioxygenase-like lactoylglutathione lyase family enzyme